MTLHLIKLSVGPSGLDDLRTRQADWAIVKPPLRHSTRNFPRRAAEIVDGGSIYWVINRVIVARQRVRDIVAGDRAAGSRGCDLMLDTELVPVRGRFMKPFQGWRYLRGEDAPEDELTGCGEGLPPELQLELARLGLL